MRFETTHPVDHAGPGVGFWTDEARNPLGYRIVRVRVWPHRTMRGANTKSPERWDVFAPRLRPHLTERYLGTEPNRWRAMRLADLHYLAERNFVETA